MSRRKQVNGLGLVDFHHIVCLLSIYAPNHYIIDAPINISKYLLEEMGYCSLRAHDLFLTRELNGVEPRQSGLKIY